MKVTVIPAYGRDYKSKADVLEAWDAGVDFIVATFGVPWDGKPINKEQADDAGYMVWVRYNNLRRTVEVSS